MAVNQSRAKFHRLCRLMIWWAAIAAVALLTVWICSVRVEPWLAAALSSRLSLWCMGIILVSAVALAACLGVLWRAGAAFRPRRRSQDGAVILEFAMVLPFVLFLVLLMIQSSLLMAGNVCVHYAAYCAARSAIVAIPDHVSDSEPQNVMDAPDTSGKHDRIRMAAVWAVMPVSCGSTDIDPANASGLVGGLENVFRAYGRDVPGWLDAYVARKLQYAMDHTQVIVAAPEDGLAYGPNEDVRVHVQHVFYMSVPYIGRLFTALAEDEARELSFGNGEYGMIIRAATSLTNEGVQDYIEEEHAGY